jgi:hypothetical protein
MKAAELGHVQAIEILKNAKADAAVRDIEGKDVLFYCLSAPTGRHDKCLKIVLSMGASVNNKTQDGIPIFVQACKTANEHKDMCIMLLEEGADPSSIEEVTHIIVFSLISS